MAWYWWFIIVGYGGGFLFTLYLHILHAQMVTFPLAVLRSLVWPLFWLTGRPHGDQL